jgi:outer membrane protein TolC
MSMKHLVCLALSMLLGLQSAAGQTQAPLTLGETVRRALENGFDMELQRENLNITLDNLLSAQSIFDPVLSASTSQSVVRSSAEDLLPASRSEGLSTRLGVSQLLPMGTSIGVGTNLNRSELNPAFSALNPAYASDVTVGIRQPLLQGAGRAVNTAGIRRAEVGIEIAHRDYFARALDVIQATENAYYRLAGAREQLGVFNTSLELAQRLLDESRSRHKAGMATKLDLLQAQVGLANSRRNVLQAENTVKAAQDDLLSLIGRSELGQPLGAPRLEDPELSAPPDIQTSYARAQAGYPALLNARANLQLTELDVKVAGNQLLPALDLDIALGVNGSAGNSGGAFSDAFGEEGSSWQAGLTVTYPWGRSGEKARHRQAKAGLRREQLALQQLEQDVLVQVRNAVRDVETNQASVVLAAESVGLAEQQHDAERKRFNSGLSTSRLVLEAQADLESARVAQLQARLALQTALAALRRIEATGAEHYGVMELIAARANSPAPR